MEAIAQRKERKRSAAGTAAAPGPARLYALLAGAFLALLGVLGFFYDAEFGTGANLASDDLAGLLNVNGWRNVIYMASGMLALGCAPRWPRRTAFGLGLFYLVFAIWGFDQTERDIGNLLDAIPLGNNDNALHLALGIVGLGAALIDGPLPKPPERLRALPGRVAKPLLAAARSAGEKLRRTRKPKAAGSTEPAKPKAARSNTPAKPAKRELPRPRPRRHAGDDD